MKKTSNTTQPLEKGVLKYRLVGKEETTIDFDSFEKPIGASVCSALIELKKAAKNDKFDLRLASGYRSFDCQLAIWNAKASGERLVLDSDEKPIDIKMMDSKKLLFAILRWTALPGASRHHWGTDFDVYEESALKNGYQLKLTVEETRAGGILGGFYSWLDNYLASSSVFCRPYAVDLGGVSPEPWHLSYLPEAEKFEEFREPEMIKEELERADILLKNEIIECFDEIYPRYILGKK